jgi:hypothetical protein
MYITIIILELLAFQQHFSNNYMDNGGEEEGRRSDEHGRYHFD